MLGLVLAPCQPWYLDLRVVAVYPVRIQLLDRACLVHRNMLFSFYERWHPAIDEDGLGLNTCFRTQGDGGTRPVPALFFSEVDHVRRDYVPRPVVSSRDLQ